MDIQKYKVNNTLFRNSYEASELYLSRNLSQLNPAAPNFATVNFEEELFRFQLMAANVCPRKETAELIRNTAVRLYPQGALGAFVKKIPDQGYYILIDSGTVDILGNIYSLLFALFEQNEKVKDHNLTTDKIYQYLFSLAFLVFDVGLRKDSKLKSFKHFHSSNLSSDGQLHAMFLAATGVKFIMLHEFGHIADGSLGELNKTVKEIEYSADFFSLVSLKDIVALERPFNPRDMEFTIIGVILLVSILKFYQESFSGIEVSFRGNTYNFPKYNSSYPSGNERLQNIVDIIPKRLHPTIFSNRFLNTAFSQLESAMKKIEQKSYPKGFEDLFYL